MLENMDLDETVEKVAFVTSEKHLEYTVDTSEEQLQTH